MLMNNLVFTMISRGWAWNIVRSLFGWLDSVAYFLFSTVMQLIFDLVSVTSNPAFNNFYDNIHSRIYAVLAIYMLFKITISLLTYLVNPDSATDKERGVGKMATRVIVSLVMLIGFPAAFQFINRIQPHILEAIPRIILGTETVTSTDTGEIVDSSDLGGQMGSTGKKIAFDTYNGVWFNNNCADGDYDNCFAYKDEDGMATVEVAVEHINDPADGDSSSYKYNYFPLIGFVVGIVMTIILLGYCVDISIRVFKLIILQIIAPIPIISYIDPKSSKDGAFSKWIKMVSSVYLDLFIKMAIIYFVLLVINELVTSGTIMKVAIGMFGQDGIVRASMVLIALIVGLLFFAKDAPKFIADALGVKMDENGKLFGGLGKIMAAGAIGAGAIGSGIASGRSSYLADEANNKNHNAGRWLKNIGAGLVGAASGLGTGASAAVNAKDHYTKAAMDAMAKRNATSLAAGSAGSTFFGRMGSTLMGLTKGETLAASGDREIKNLEDFGKALDAIGDRAKSEMVKQNWTLGESGFKLTDDKGNIIKDSNGNDYKVLANYKSFMATKNAAASAGKKEFKYTFKVTDSNGVTRDVERTISMQEANMQEGFILKNNEDDYIRRASSSVTDDKGNVVFAGDKDLQSLITDAESKAVNISDSDITNEYYSNGKFHVSGRNSVKSTREAIGIEIRAEQRKNATNKANDRFSNSGKSS